MNKTLVTSLFVSFLASTQTYAANTFRPVIITKTTGSLSEDIESTLMEAISDSLQKATMQNIAKRISGTGEEFKNNVPPTILASMTSTVRDFDIELNRRLSLAMPILKAKGASTNWQLEVYFTWSDQTFKQATYVDSFSSTFGLMGMLAFNQLKKEVGKNLPQEVLKAMDQSVKLDIIDGNKVPGGIQQIFDRGKEIYEYLAEGNQDYNIPVLSRMLISVNQASVNLEFTQYIKPAGFYIPQSDQAFVSAKSVEFRPKFFGSTQNLARLSFTRNYGQSQSTPTLKIGFGYLATKDLRTLAYCINDCEKRLFTVPTIRLKYAPDNLPDSSFAELAGSVNKLQVSSKSKLGRLIPNVSLSIDQLKSAAKSVSNLMSDQDIFLMIKEITIDMQNPSGFKVLPELSKINMVFRFRDPLRGDHFVVIDSTSEILKDQLDGTSIFAKMTANKLEEKISAQLNNALIGFDDSVDQSAGKIMTELTKDMIGD